MNKVKQGIIFSIFFLFIWLIPLFIIFIFKNIIPLLPQEGNIAFELLPVISLSLLIGMIIQFVLSVILGLYFTRRVKLFDSVRMPSFVLLGFVIVDCIIVFLIKENFSASQYFLFLSFSKNFIPIYIVAIVNALSIKKKE